MNEQINDTSGSTTGQDVAAHNFKYGIVLDEGVAVEDVAGHAFKWLVLPEDENVEAHSARVFLVPSDNDDVEGHSAHFGFLATDTTESADEVEGHSFHIGLATAADDLAGLGYKYQVSLPDGLTGDDVEGHFIKVLLTPTDGKGNDVEGHSFRIGLAAAERDGLDVEGHQFRI